MWWLMEFRKFLSKTNYFKPKYIFRWIKAPFEWKKKKNKTGKDRMREQEEKKTGKNVNAIGMSNITSI